MVALDEQINTDSVAWGVNGLVPVIAQDCHNGCVLMLAWMNRDALTETIRRQEAVYWSRSRKCLWHKGEESGCIQKVRDIFIDCDSDTLMLSVEQLGSGACHTGAPSCFFRQFTHNQWHKTSAPVYNLNHKR